MKTNTLMVNAAMMKAVDVGLIPDGVTIEQRGLMEQVIQAALDAHATLRAFDEINFKIITDPVAIQAAIESDR